MFRRRGSLGGIVWVLIGIFVAVNHGYYSVSNVSHVVSFIFAIFLWPILFLGANLHLNLGF